jgi:nucleoid-associated protein YgaU
MRSETKIGATITVLALAIVASFVAVRGGRLFSSDSTEVPTPPAVVEPTAAAPDNTGTVASPPPIGVNDNAERSFRPKEIAPAAPVEPQPAPAERTGLAAVQPPTPPTPPTPEVTPAPAPAQAPAPAPAVVNVVAAPAAAPAPPPTPTAEVAPAIGAAAPPVEPTKEHIIQVGETFSSLAIKYYGNAKYANLITKANPDRDPKHLNLGMKIKIPPAPVAAAPAGSAPATPAAIASAKKVIELPPIPADRSYKVQQGESWNDLGKKFLGDGNRWPELYELNKERVPRNPHALRPGVTIEVPASKPS